MVFGVIKFRTLCVFEPPFVGLKDNVRCLSWAHWKSRTVDFLLVLIELFSLGVTAESLRAKGDRKSAISHQRDHFDPKFQVERVVPTNHFCTVR